MKIRPLHDWAVIRRIDAGETTAGGIIIPAVAKEKPAEGIVEAIGPGKYTAEGKGKKEKFVATTVKPGQRVVFSNFMAKDVEVDGQEITLVREEDILGTHLGGQQLAPKESGPVSIREQMPLLVPGEVRVKPAVSEKPKSRAAAPRRASGEKSGAKKKAVKKAPGTRIQKETGAAGQKKRKKESTKKTTGKVVSAKRPKTASRKTARKPGGAKKATASRPSAGKKKRVTGKSRRPKK